MIDISNLTVREKIGQTSQEVLSVFRTWHPGDLSGLFQQYPVGSLFVGNDVINSQGDETSVAGVIAEFQRSSRIPLSIAGDLENGAGQAVKTMTTFPPQLCLGATGSEELAYNFGKVYRACFQEDVHAVMTGHIALPWLDKTVGRGGRPRPGTVSPDIMTKLLRDELGFEGVVVSDALIMAGFTGWADWETRTIEAFNAGTDVMLWPGKEYVNLMERAIDDGRVSMERLDQAVERILRFKKKQGLFGKEFTAEIAKERPLPEAIHFSRQLADEGITLVRNRDNLLPLQTEIHKKVLVLAATINPDQAEEHLQPFLAELKNQGIEATLKINGNCLDLVDVTNDDYDALIVVYLVSMHQPKNTVRPVGAVAECMWMQQNTSLNPVIVSLGCPYLLNDMPYASTYINAYGDCTEIQASLVNKLYGKDDFKGTSSVDPGGEW